MFISEDDLKPFGVRFLDRFSVKHNDLKDGVPQKLTVVGVGEDGFVWIVLDSDVYPKVSGFRINLPPSTSFIRDAGFTPLEEADGGIGQKMGHDMCLALELGPSLEMTKEKDW